MKKKIYIVLLFLFTSFCFFYTEKAIILARNVDPIMIKIKDAKSNIKGIKPIIKNNEYISGKNKCTIDEIASYNKMKKIKKYDENLLVMKEIKMSKKTKNKYIIGSSRTNKDVSLILLIKNKLDSNLLTYLENKNVKVNFFIDGYFLENNINYLKELSNYGNLYNYGRNKIYDSNYIIYDNNMLEMISKNKSNYCLLKTKNKKQLKLCNSYSMNVIKPIYINETNVKERLSNGNIYVVQNEIEYIINYIVSKGYNIKVLNDLLDESNDCD